MNDRVPLTTVILVELGKDNPLLGEVPRQLSICVALYANRYLVSEGIH